MPKLVFGCGYLGCRVARRWQEGGHEVFVVTRTAERAEQLAASRFRPIVGDLTQSGALADLPAADAVLFAVGSDRRSSQSILDVQVGGLANVLEALSDSTRRVIYISSTGVFGQNDGQWVDESSPCNPTREGGRACLEAEQLLAAHRLGARAIVLRLAGLYGPGRIPRRDDLTSGRPLAAPSQSYLNLIHVDDAADVVLAAETAAVPPRWYLVSDGRPVLREEYYRYLAELLDAPAPRFQSPPAESSAARRAASDKRVDNRRMRKELNIMLAMPSYREGLTAIVAAEKRTAKK